MSGYIYCITNSQYKFDDTYKLGYTAINLPLEDVKKKLLQRYETYFVNAECIMIFLVKQPINAEKRLFELLKDYNIQKEMFKADYETIIKPALEKIKTEFNIDIKVDNKSKYIGKINKITKKIAYYSKNIRELNIFICKQFCLMPNEKLNQANCINIQNIRSKFENFENLTIQNRIGKQKIDKSLYNNLKKDFEFILNNIDYDDINLNLFLDNLLTL